MIIKILVCLAAGLGAGVGTGLAGLSAAAVISPMLITFLGFDAYEAVGIALASDVLHPPILTERIKTWIFATDWLCYVPYLSSPWSEAIPHPYFQTPPWEVFPYS